LVDPQRLDAVLGHRHEGERLAARLVGFQRVTTRTYPYPFIVEAGGGSVEGVLLMDLSPSDMWTLDEYEEVDSDVYRRETVQVEALGCGPRPLQVRAEAYVAGAALQASTVR
jgi:hypothetical protein